MFKTVAFATAAAVVALAAPITSTANAQTGFGAYTRSFVTPDHLILRVRHTATPRINRRIRRQSRRIRRGRRDGSLTRYEARRLWSGLRRIQFARLRAASDGIVTMRERFRLHRKLDRNSRRIWRLRHNGRY